MKIYFALAAVIGAAACKKTDSAIRREDTSVIPPVSVSADSAATAVKTCGVTGLPVLTDDGIGELKEGRSVADIKELCEIVSDSRQQGSEGMMERVLVVRVGSETVQAIVDNEKIYRIVVSSPRLLTSDSLAVDTPLHRIATARGARFFPGEDGVYGFVANHCAMSFRFSIPLRPPRGGDWTAARIDSAHGDAAVDRILITKCRR
ncbi:MAG TPA: hypothetical protein VFD22_10220 [Gemmatimonadaceae bacterium]|nr:hypothetical protein [Gemmatimonadaceae bacterium]